MNFQSLSGRYKPAVKQTIGSSQGLWRQPSKSVSRRSVQTTEPTKCDIDKVEDSPKGAFLAAMMGTMISCNNDGDHTKLLNQQVIAFPKLKRRIAYFCRLKIQYTGTVFIALSLLNIADF